MTLDPYWHAPRVKFTVPAPEAAPEVKGARCYFRPEFIEWTVTPDRTSARVHGSPTRDSSFGGSKTYRADDFPDWLPVPRLLLDHVRKTVLRLAEVSTQ